MPARPATPYKITAFASECHTGRAHLDRPSGQFGPARAACKHRAALGRDCRRGGFAGARGRVGPTGLAAAAARVCGGRSARAARARADIPLRGRMLRGRGRARRGVGWGWGAKSQDAAYVRRT